MVANANAPRPDWALYGCLIALMGLIVGGVGLLAVLILAEGRATRAEQQAIRVELSAETEKLRTEQSAETEKLRTEQSAETEKLRSELQTYRAEQKAEAETARAEQKAEAEETRRYIAEAIAEASKRAAVNSIRIDYLEEAVEPSPASN